MVKYAYYPFTFGYLKIGYTTEYIVSVKNVSENGDDNAPSTLSDEAYKQIAEYLQGSRKKFDLPINAIGTDFQQKVWQELQNIPYGKTCSYKDIATKVGNAKASRAIGLANNKNPIIIIIPCHRVIGHNGSLTGYAGGLEMKKYLLEMESKNS